MSRKLAVSSRQKERDDAYNQPWFVQRGLAECVGMTILRRTLIAMASYWQWRSPDQEHSDGLSSSELGGVHTEYGHDGWQTCEASNVRCVLCVVTANPKPVHGSEVR